MRRPGSCCALLAAIAGFSVVTSAPSAKDLADVTSDTNQEAVDEILTDKTYSAEGAAELAEDASEDNEDQVENSLDAAAASGAASTDDWLVQQASNDTGLPGEYVAGNMTLLRAEAEVQRARQRLKVALTRKKMQEMLMDQSKFEVAQAEVEKAKAEKLAAKDATAVSKTEHLDAHHGTWPKFLASKTAHEKKADAVKKKVVADRKAAQVAMLESEKDAGIISKKEFATDKATLTLPAASTSSGIFTTLLYVLPIVALVGFALRYHHLKRRRLAVQEGVWLG